MKSLLSTTVWRAQPGYFCYIIELMTYIMILHYLINADDLEYVFKLIFFSIYYSLFLLRTKDMLNQTI